MAAKPKQAALAAAAAERSWKLEKGDAGYRMADAATGTLTAALWANDVGYGLTLDQVAAVLDGTFQWPTVEAAVAAPADAEYVDVHVNGVRLSDDRVARILGT